MSQGDRLVPLTNDIMGQMLVQGVEVMIECGLGQRGAEAEETAERAMQVLAAQGLIDSAGDVPIGNCLLLPGSSGRGFRLLLVTPWLADEYDSDLRRRKTWPMIMFDRTAAGEVIVPKRSLLARFEALATNPTAPESTRQFALTLARRSQLDDLVFPADSITLALTVTDRGSGTETVIEALPGGQMISIGGGEWFTGVSSTDVRFITRTALTSTEEAPITGVITRALNEYWTR